MKLFELCEAKFTISDTATKEYVGGMMHAINMRDLQYVNADGKTVAEFTVEKKSNVWHLHTEVEPDWQRKGVATFLYDHVEKLAQEAGAELKGSASQTQAAKEFWTKRNATKHK